MFAFIFLAAQAIATAAPVVERVDETSYLLGLAVDASLNVAQGQARLAPAAKRACGARLVTLGRYRFVAEEGKNRFEQELLCLDRRHKLSLIERAAGNAALEPSRPDQQAVLATSYRYFAAKDAGRYAEAHQALSGRMKSRFPLAEWTRSARGFNAEAGAVRGRRVVEITWYKNPEGAPEPGLYVAADFSADFERAEFVCGYLMWQVQPDGTFRLAREEQNMAPKRPSGRAIAQIDRDPLRSRMGCKD
ncbi:MAG TPA: DUF4019 domain-containing protein [Allosphingosinicella sp.]|jgi:hypothetical protein|uniref:DUF4019 domain-containing protein n=1 Tax=Allosphingosinicella sp. TaxID=2823234 RepID=UPI002F297718